MKVRHSREHGLRSRLITAVCPPQLCSLPKANRSTTCSRFRIVACLSVVLQQATWTLSFDRKAVSQFHQLDDVLHHDVELQRRADAFEFLAGGAVEADLDFVQPRLDQPPSASRSQQRSVAEDLHPADAFLFRIGDAVFKLFVQQRLAEVVQVDFAASGGGALVDQPGIEIAVHRGDGAAHFAVGADDASGVAGVGRFQANHCRKSSLGRIENAADDPAQQLRR